MKRRALKLLLFLLAGAILNIAVAWAFGAFGDARSAPEQFNVSHDPVTGIWISDTRRDALGFSQSIRRKFWPLRYGVAGNAYILEFDMTKAQATVLAPGERIDVTQKAAPDNTLIMEPWMNSYGYPLRSMCCWLENLAGYPSSNATSWTGDVRVVAGIDLSKTKSVTPDAHLLPLQPIRSGFVINTIFYAALLWMIFATPLALRCHIRRRRGQCAACGYSLRGSASENCPECGTPK